MKHRWITLLSVFCLVAVLVLSTCLIAAKAVSRSSLYKKAEEYARTTVFPYVVGHLEKNNSDYSLGESFETGIYTTQLRASSDAGIGGCVFFINDETNEPVSSFFVFYNSNEDFGFMGPLNADGLADGISVMKRLKKEADLPESFTILKHFMHDYLIVGTFGQAEYVIACSDSQLDESYYQVQSYLDLPTLQEVNDIITAEGKKAEEIAKETGQYPYGGGSVVIKAHAPSERGDAGSPAVQLEDTVQPNAGRIQPDLQIPAESPEQAYLQKDSIAPALPQTKSSPAEPAIEPIDNVQPILATGPVQTEDRQPLTGLIIAAAVFAVLLLGSGATILLLHRRKSSV